jgi:hypothetical protein
MDLQDTTKEAISIPTRADSMVQPSNYGQEIVGEENDVLKNTLRRYVALLPTPVGIIVGAKKLKSKKKN